MDASTSLHVLLLLEIQKGYGRSFLEGVLEYAQSGEPWTCWLTDGFSEQSLKEIRNWKGSGIIGIIDTPEVEQALLEANVPTVGVDMVAEQLAQNNPLSRFSSISAGCDIAVRMAIDHLRDKRSMNFGYVGMDEYPWSQRRSEAFCQYLQQQNLAAFVYSCPENTTKREEVPLLGRWLTEIPGPCGIICCNDDRGRMVLEACRAEGLAVPEEVAVVGIDNDELLCKLSIPPLSSVDLNSKLGGVQAAKLLEKLVRGELTEPQRLTIEPFGVVVRKSSNILSVEDELLCVALRFISDSCGRMVSVGSVVEHLDVSRRVLEKRFRELLGRSVHEEIQRVRIDEVKRLLTHSDLNVDEIAEIIGFTSGSYMCRVFRRETGITTHNYRQSQK